MTKPGPASCPDGAASHNTVFIDTSLDTHLAMAVSDGDTVSDLKEKIEKEHPLCFPYVGNIKIHALKVKRKGYFYHLSDSMYLKSAFVGVNKSWFLSMDASITDGHSTDPNTGNLSTYFGRANNPSVDGINLARNNHCGQKHNHDAPPLPDNAAQQYVNENAPIDIYFGSCHSSKKDIMIKKAEVAHSVENFSKVQSDRTGHGCEDLNKTLESLPAVKVNHKSKKRKTKGINEHEVDNHTSDGNGQNPLQQVVGSCEKFRDFAQNEVSNLLMMESKSKEDEPCQISSSNTRDKSEHGMKGKYNLSKGTEVDGKNDKSENAFHLMDNSSLEVAAQAGSTAKKMHKTEKINGVINGVEGNRDLVSDSSKATSTPKVSSEYLSDNEKTAKVVLGSLSTEPDVRLLETGTSDVKKKKKKRKNKLSDCPNQAVGLISSRAGDQQDASRESDITTVPSQDIEEASISDLLGTSVRERHNDSYHKTAENFASSLAGESHGNMNSMDLGDVQSIRDASDKAVLGVKRKTDSKDLAFQSDGTNNLQKSICTSEDAHDVQSNHLTCKTGQIVAIPEERDSMQHTDTKATMVENCHSSSWDGTDNNVKATHISELLHLKGTSENAKHSKKKKTKKSRDSAEGRRINLVRTGARDSAHDISPTELHSIPVGDNSSSKAEMGESNVSLMKGENRASILTSVRNIDIDEANNSIVEPLPQINKTQAGAENMDGQVRKKIKKRPVTSMKSLSDLQAENIDNEDSLPSNRSNREVKSVCTAAKKTKLPKVKSKNDIEEANVDSTRFSEVESSPPSICKRSRTVGSSLAPSHVSEDNHEGRSLEANICSNTSKDETADNVDNRFEVPSESDKADMEERAGRLQHESVKLHVDKLSREKSANTLLRTKRKKKDSNACSSGFSLSLQNIQKSDENTETGRHCQTSNSSSLKLHGSPSKEKCGRTLRSDNKVKKISRGGVKSLPSDEHKQQMSDSNKAARVRANAVDSSWDSTEKNSETFALPRTRLNSKNSANMVHQDQKHMGHQSTGIGHPIVGRKPSQNRNKDVTRSERRNLLATSGGIFKDASSDSSENEGETADSDASTRSPDNSLSSDFSDGESNGNINSSENGSVDLERKDIRRRSIRKKGSSSPENMTLDTILRSSSRYKKAKLTAAQLQQDDTESQPVDFVPDSQANL